MHELPVIKKILDIALDSANAHQVIQIKRIHLEVGELSDLQDKWMQQYFDFVSRDTIAQGAELSIKRIPVMLKCVNCSKEFPFDLKGEKIMVCPECNGKNCPIISGTAYKVVHLEAV